MNSLTSITFKKPCQAMGAAQVPCPSPVLNKCKNHGFTLVELMVTLSIVVILATLAVPSFRALIASTRMTSQANEFVAMLAFTRSEAVKRNARVTMCKSSDSTSCTTTGTWAQGYIVFTDAGATIGTVDSGEDVLRVSPALTNGSTLVGSADVAGPPVVLGVANFLSFLSNGQSTQSGKWDLCPATTSLPGRDIVLVAATGSPTVAKDTTLPCS